MIKSIPNFKSYATTGVGVALAQIISFASVPLIANLAGPEQFGNFGIVYSNLVIAMVLVSFKTELSLFVLKGITSDNAVAIISRLAVVTSLFLTPTLMSLNILPMSSSGYLEFLAIFALLLGQTIFELHIQSNIKKGHFKNNALQRIYKSFLYPIIFILFYVFGGSDSYIIVLSFGLAAFISTVSANGLTECKLDKKYRYKHIILLAKRARKTAMFMTPSHLLSRYSGNSFVVLAGLQSGNSTFVAMYLLAYKFVIAPASILTAANSDVVKREILVDPVKGVKDFLKVSALSSIVAIVIIMFTILFSEKIVLMTMGEEWKQTANIAIALLPLLFTILVFSPLTHVYIVLNRQGLDLTWQIMNTLVTTLAILWGLAQSFEFAVWSFSIVYSLSIFISFLICLVIALKADSNAK